MDEMIIILRIIERCVISLLFCGVVVFLLYIYRTDVVGKEAKLEAGSVKISAVVTLPIVAAGLLLGYAYVVLSNPVSLKSDGSQHSGSGSREARLYEGEGLSRSFTAVARREGGLEASMIARAQAILRTSVIAEKLKQGGGQSEVDRLLGDGSMPYDALAKAISSLSIKAAASGE